MTDSFQQTDTLVSYPRLLPVPPERRSAAPGIIVVPNLVADTLHTTDLSDDGRPTDHSPLESGPSFDTDQSRIDRVGTVTKTISEPGSQRKHRTAKSKA